MKKSLLMKIFEKHGIIILCLVMASAIVFQSRSMIMLQSELDALKNVVAQAPKEIITEKIVSKNVPVYVEKKIVEPQPANPISVIVKKVNPAVVAVTAWRNVPKYETYVEDTGYYTQDFFGNRVPYRVQKYKQIGTEKKDFGGGSGFVVRSNGIIVTNRHVVNDRSAQYDVTLSNGKRLEATVLYIDDKQDLAVMKISKIGVYPTVAMGDSEKVELGDQVIAIGNALAEFKNSISVGIISGKNRDIVAGSGMFGDREKLEKLFQTDAAINSGNSGGPLINNRGEVIGVNVATTGGAQNISFTLPINLVKDLLNKVGI